MIVEFLEGQTFITALTLEAKSHRLLVLSVNGREMTISSSRVLSTSARPDPVSKTARLELLRQIDQQRDELSKNIDLTELWEVLEGDGESFVYEDLASLYYGRETSVDEVAATMRAIFHDGLKFKFSPQMAMRRSAEEIEGLVLARKKAETEALKEEELAAWLQKVAKGMVAPEPETGGDEARRWLTDFVLNGERSPVRQQALGLLKKAGLKPDQAAAFDALVGLGEFNRHENLDLRRLEIPLTFDKHVIDEATALSAKGPCHGTGRLDLTNMPTMTIDSNGARDFDDAVSVQSLADGRWQVAVHITDVASLIPAGSLLDLEAQNRASSIYLPEGKYPMLPAELSEKLFSLTLGDVKPTFSFLATLEADGSVNDYSMAQSLIKVDRQMTFAEVDHNLDEDSDLVDLWDMAQLLMSSRLNKGGVSLNLPKLNVFFGPDGSLVVNLAQWDTPAKLIVGELMILANFLTADILHKNGYPCPYRVQEKMKENNLAELKLEGLSEEEAHNMRLAADLVRRRKMGRSGLSFEAVPHHGLGLPVYTSFTAPMRRYVDLLVIRQLQSLAEGRAPAMDEAAFRLNALPAYDLQQRIQKMQNRRQRYWLAVYLADKIGSEFQALVFEMNSRRFRVCVLDFMLELDIHWPSQETVPPNLWGRTITLKLVKAVPGEDLLKFEPVIDH